MSNSSSIRHIKGPVAGCITYLRTNKVNVIRLLIEYLIHLLMNVFIPAVCNGNCR